jgi:hypothetical protein
VSWSPNRRTEVTLSTNRRTEVSLSTNRRTEVLFSTKRRPEVHLSIKRKAIQIEGLQYLCLLTEGHNCSLPRNRSAEIIKSLYKYIGPSLAVLAYKKQGCSVLVNIRLQ